MWLNTVEHDLRAYNLTLNEAIDLAQNHPLWRLKEGLNNNKNNNNTCLTAVFRHYPGEMVPER